MVAAEAAAGGPGGGVEEGVGESSSPPRDAAPAPAVSGGSGGSGGAARDICGQVYERLVADGHEAASDPEFREKLLAHFARLPHRFDRLAGPVLARTSFVCHGSALAGYGNLWSLCRSKRAAWSFGLGLRGGSGEVQR